MMHPHAPTGKLCVFLLCAACWLAAAGCEDSAKQPVRVRPPVEAPPPVPVAVSPLPPAAQPGPGISSIPQPVNRVDQLVKTAEEAFHSGEEEYKAGHLDRARQEFDRAVDALLTSGYDLQANPRLLELFDRIVDTVHHYELEAFKEGDGFSEQKADPAPIDEIAGMTFAVDPRLREKAQQGLQEVSHDLPLTVNDTVVSFLNYFQTPRGRAIVETGLRRAGRYREMISRILREEGVPQDLIYLAQAESAFQPHALSRAGARGIWQFLSWRGKEYGLKHNWWVDDRQDPEKATRAAARHLRDLYDQFGDWYLVLAAYNSGPGGVQRAIERTGYADFWQLYRLNALPRETRNYVPIILALTLVAKDSPRYGIQVDPEPPVQADSVRPGHPVDLRLVAETIDEDLDTLKALNPQLLRLVTPANPDFELKLPEGTRERFLSGIAAIPPEKWVSWRRHRVEEGETLGLIARKYHLNVAVIADANNLPAHAALQAGDKLIIPAAARPQPPQGKLVRYRVRRGDTLESIADEFDCTVGELKRWNGLRGTHVARGIRLRVYPGGRAAPRTPKPHAREVGRAIAEWSITG